MSGLRANRRHASSDTPGLGMLGQVVKPDRTREWVEHHRGFDSDMTGLLV